MVMNVISALLWIAMIVLCFMGYWREVLIVLGAGGALLAAILFLEILVYDVSRAWHAGKRDS